MTPVENGRTFPKAKIEPNQKIGRTGIQLKNGKVSGAKP